MRECVFSQGSASSTDLSLSSPPPHILFVFAPSTFARVQSTVRRRLWSRRYQWHQQVIDDLRLVWSNAMAFNQVCFVFGLVGLCSFAS